MTYWLVPRRPVGADFNVVSRDHWLGPSLKRPSVLIRPVAIPVAISRWHWMPPLAARHTGRSRSTHS